MDAIQPGATHNMKATHLALKQRPPTKLLKAQLSGIFQAIFSPTQIPGDCVRHSVCLCERVLFERGKDSLRVLAPARLGGGGVQGGAGK